MATINNPHDRFFRSSMSNLVIAREFFSTYLPSKIRDLINLETLRLESQSFVDEELSEIISDVLYSVDFVSSDRCDYHSR